MGTCAHVCSGGTGAQAGKGQRERSDYHFLPLQTPSAPHPPSRTPISPPPPPHSHPTAITSPSHAPNGRHPPPHSPPHRQHFPLTPGTPIMPCMEGPPQTTTPILPCTATIFSSAYISHHAPLQTTTPIMPPSELHFPSCPTADYNSHRVVLGLVLG